MTVHGDMYKVIHDLVLFKPMRQIRISHATFKVTSFVDLRLYQKLFNPLECYINWLEAQLTNILTNPGHKFIKRYPTKVTDQVPLQDLTASSHLKVHQ